MASVNSETRQSIDVAPMAVIVLMNKLSDKIGTLTDMQGQFFLSVDPGEYDVKIMLTGYGELDVKNVVFKAGERKELIALLDERILPAVHVNSNRKNL